MMPENSKQPAGAGTQLERDVVEHRNAAGTGGGTSSSSSGASANKASPEEIKQQARDLANQTKQQGKSMLEQQRSSAAGQVDSIAHAFRNTAEQLQREGQSTGNYVGMVADQLETAARQLRDKNIDEIMHDVQNLARRSPATFIAGSIAAGFLLTRFFKSSGQQDRNYQGYDSHGDADGARRFSSSYGSDSRMGDEPFNDAGDQYAYSSGDSGSGDDFGDLSYRPGSPLPDERTYPGTTSGLSSQPLAGNTGADTSASSAVKSDPSYLGGNNHGNR